METYMSEIKIVRLATGEELICELSGGPDYFTLKDVAILIPTQENSLGLAPFMAYSEAPKGMTIASNFVMFSVDPVDGLKKQYQQMFSKVITPDKKIII
jgi:hypothetical protein